MRLLTLIIVTMLAFTSAAFATSNKGASPKLRIEGDANGFISNQTLKDYYESCLYHIPDRFTPDARKYYCTCNAAALQGNFKMQEYTELKRLSNRKPGNKTFEKYVHVAVAPCLNDVPVKQIEYLACLLDSSDDDRIGNVPEYCNCVTRKMASHVKEFSEPEIMSRLAEDPTLFNDPVDALWNNQLYLTTKYKSRDECIMGHH